MTPFCTDIDLLHWEPNILVSAAFTSQTLMSGHANLSGTTLTISSGSFSDSHIEPNQVIVLSGGPAGSFPIVSVDSATQLTISVLFDQLFPDSGSPQASPIGTASGLSFVICTFWPQRRVISEILSQAAGIIPGDPAHRKRGDPQPAGFPPPLPARHVATDLHALSAVPDAPRGLCHPRRHVRNALSTLRSGQPWSIWTSTATAKSIAGKD